VPDESIGQTGFPVEADSRAAAGFSDPPKDLSVTVTPISLVVPLCDEEQGVPALVEALRAWLTDARLEGREAELVLVDDGSRDETHARLARGFPAEAGPWRILRHADNRGLTAALRTGSEAARHPLVGWLDADLTYEPGILLELAKCVDQGAELAIASCHHPNGRLEGVAHWRAGLSRLASRLYRRATGRSELHTFTCMVRVQRRELLDATWPERGGYLGVAEQLLRTLARGARVAEVPATLHRRRLGQSKMRIARAALGHLGLVWAARRGRL
jgi:glycosyltransferase involved in cell wall biosynthesis